MKPLLKSSMLLLLILVSVGCYKGMAFRGNYRLAASRKQYIVLIDLSASRTTEKSLESKRFLDQLVGRLSFGDRIGLIQMQDAGEAGNTRRWQKIMPSPVDPALITDDDKEKLSRRLKDVVTAESRFFDPKNSPQSAHTDIFKTLLVAEEVAHDSDGRQTVLVLLSDMLQSDGNFEMSKLRRMPKGGWLESQKRSGLIPSYPGACVLVVGADATTREGALVRRFWQSYFAATGTTLSLANYRATPPAPDLSFCQ